MKDKKIKISRVAVELPGVELPKEEKDELKRLIRKTVRNYLKVERFSVNLQYNGEG